MEIIYTRKAKQDLADLRDYYSERSHLALQNIVEDIVSTVEDIPRSLAKGRQTPHPEVWEKISPRYSYLLPYFVWQDRLYILRVYHPKRQSLNYLSIVDVTQ